MSIELKIKSKHLGIESKIIRHEELKIKKQIRWHRDRQMNTDKLHAQLFSLSQHRKIDVRNENRATFLARAFIEGRAYKTIENKRMDDANFRNILARTLSMIIKYGTPGITLQQLADWSEYKLR